MLSICGGTRLRQCRTSGAAAYPGRLSNSTQIAPIGQNEPIKRKGHRANSSEACIFNGAGNRNRTRNPLITNQLRYRCAMPANRLPIMP